MNTASSLPSVSVNYASNGSSKKSNELGMRIMQERAYDKRGEQYLLIKSPPASGKSRALMFVVLDKLSKQKVYVAEFSEERNHGFDKNDYRLRVIYDNRTESSLLLRSLQKALYEDDTSRRIVPLSAGPLFDDVADEEDLASGIIYVLRSKSDHPVISQNREVIHKIGVTGGKVEKRIANAKIDPTFLMADVEVVATYELFNINRVKLENLLHRFFENAKLNIEIADRFGNPVSPKEWFLVPLFIVDEVVEKIRDGCMADYMYDHQKARLVRG